MTTQAALAARVMREHRACRRPDYLAVAQRFRGLCHCGAVIEGTLEAHECGPDEMTYADAWQVHRIEVFVAELLHIEPNAVTAVQAERNA